MSDKKQIKKIKKLFKKAKKIGSKKRPDPATILKAVQSLDKIDDPVKRALYATELTNKKYGLQMNYSAQEVALRSLDEITKKKDKREVLKKFAQSRLPELSYYEKSKLSY